MENDMMIILYVADQQRSKEFYETVLDRKPELNVPGMTSFKVREGISLGLMPETGIEKILGDAVPSPGSGNGIPRCELYLFVNDPDENLEVALNAGAKIISRSKERNWGDLAAYCADPDGHILAFARSLRS
ncbi:MAG: hypothetical protein GY751_16260 [Bacteroidetes bacterium]|nr:hypothetical protein [Bacteroidota bacterium]